jgi:hypothetical protein
MKFALMLMQVIPQIKQAVWVPVELFVEVAVLVGLLLIPLILASMLGLIVIWKQLVWLEAHREKQQSPELPKTQSNKISNGVLPYGH